MIPDLKIVEDQGYLFRDCSTHPYILNDLTDEAEKLDFLVGDHVNYPINPDTKVEVRQLHERIYLPLDHPSVPSASALCHTMAELLASELPGWLLNEIGYQRYRGESDWISPHRDRKSDRQLSLTITIYGSAWVNIYSCAEDPPDYSKLTLIDKHLTKPGTVMFLRAPGFGSGEQIIHEVCPPIGGPRLILNLRMRPTILKQPGELANDQTKIS